jgi:hypothetical protein
MEVAPAQLCELLKNERPAIAFWNAAIAQPIQFRTLSATREIRERLIAFGVREHLLAFPGWLHAGEDRQGQQEHV